MGCSHEWGELLSRHVDHETAPEETSRLEEHLRDCTECRDLLAVFSRNENMLDNALTGEAFGSQLVEDVMAQIRRQESPTVIAPEVEEPAARPRLLPILMGVATAAALLIAVVALVVPRGSDEALRTRVTDLSKEVETYRNAVGAIRQMNDQTYRQLAASIEEQRGRHAADKMREQAPDNTTVAIWPSKRSVEISVRVRDMSLFKSFTLERSEHARNAWEVVTKGLTVPSCSDGTLKPGILYDYRFTGTRHDGTQDLPMPAVTKVGLAVDDMTAPDRSIIIEFIAAMKDQATFRLTRSAGGRLVDTFFTVRPGQAIGGLVQMDDVPVDFSSGLVLAGLVEDTQVLSFRFGNEERTQARATVRADLRNSASGTTLPIFLGSSTWTPAAR